MSYRKTATYGVVINEYRPGVNRVRYMTQAAAETLIADAGQTFTRGEKVEYTDPSPGGNIGLVCTTGGIGGVAVFKAFGVIAA